MFCMEDPTAPLAGSVPDSPPSVSEALDGQSSSAPPPNGPAPGNVLISPGWFRIANGIVDGGLVGRLPASALRVWLWMARMANLQGVCWPTLQFLAAHTQVDRSTVSRAIARLVKEGVVVRLAGGGKGRATRYQVLASACQNADTLPSSPAPDGQRCISAAVPANAAPVHNCRCTQAARTRHRNKTDRRSIKATCHQQRLKMMWDSTNGFQVPETAYVDLIREFPLLNIEQQLRQASAWLKANPARTHKRNWARFITNWLLRSMQHGKVFQRRPNGDASAPQRWQGRHPRDVALQL